MSPRERDRLTRQLAKHFGEPESFNAPQWFKGAWGWTLMVSVAKLIIFGSEESYAQPLLRMDRTQLQEDRYLLPGLMELTDPEEALAFAVTSTQTALPPRAPDRSLWGPYEHQQEYDVVFSLSNRDAKIPLIKAIRQVAAYGLKEAKQLAESRWAKLGPYRKEEAERIAKVLRIEGVTVEIVEATE